MLAGSRSKEELGGGGYWRAGSVEDPTTTEVVRRGFGHYEIRHDPAVPTTWNTEYHVRPQVLR